MKYPDITVNLSNNDGNAFFIIARTVKALRRHGVDESIIAEYRDQALCGDYGNVLQTTMLWVYVT